MAPLHLTQSVVRTRQLRRILAGTSADDVSIRIQLVHTLRGDDGVELFRGQKHVYCT